ncbi:MAG: discoidin domain-containing protein, partial [Clostridiales bacterium]|nr:discoidin domain-containing protein [Clostridiales bacterium]
MCILDRVLWDKVLSVFLCFICAAALLTRPLAAAAAGDAYDLRFFALSADGVPNGGNPALAKDGNLDTAWSTVDRQQAGMSFVIDMFKNDRIGKITLNRKNRGEYPGKFDVYVTEQKEFWGAPVLTAVSGKQGAATVIDFPGERRGRVIKILLTEGTEEADAPWSVSELTVEPISDAASAIAPSVVSFNEKDEARAREEMTDFLTALNILPANTGAAGDDPVTRADFAGILADFTGLKPVPEESYAARIAFSDVDGAHPAYGFISLAAALGAMDADARNAFRPNDYVTVNECVKALVSVLGYDLPAAASGGFPVGYASEARRLNLLRGTLPGDGHITIEQLTELLYNALFVPVLLQTGAGDRFRLEADKDRAAMTVWHNVRRVRGILISNGDTALTAKALSPKGTLLIGDTECYAGTVNAARLLGCNVEAFLRYDAARDAYTALRVLEDGSKNDILTIPADNITGTAGYTVSYYADSVNDLKTVKAELSPTAYMIYNGKARLPFENSLLNIHNGELRLIDNDTDGDYDVVIVREYVNYFLDSVTGRTQTVTDKYYKPRLSFDPRINSKLSLTIYKDGERVEFNAVKARQVVSVEADRVTRDADGQITVDSENSSVYTLYLSENTYSGVITEVNETDGELTLGGKSFRVDRGFVSAYESGKAARPGVGQNVTVYLDARGKVAAMNLSADGAMKYGYLINIGVTRGIAAKAEVKLLDDKGSVIVLRVSEKVTLDNARQTVTAAEAVSAFRDANTETAIPQLIGYWLNADGEIYKIDTREFNPAAEDKRDTFTFVPKASYDFNIWRNMLMSDSGNMTPSAGTKIFVVPSKPEEVVTEAESYAVYNNSFLKHDTSYSIEVYKKSEFNDAQVLVLFSGNRPSNLNEEYIVVDKVTRAVTKDGQPGYKLYCNQSGSEMQLYFDSDRVLENAGLLDGGNPLLNQGDIITIATGSNGNISEIQRIYNVKDLHITLYAWPPKYYDANRMTIGQVYNSSGNRLLVTHSKTADEVEDSDM